MYIFILFPIFINIYKIVMKKRFNLKEQEGETSEEELYDSLGTVLELATTMCNDHENETYHTLDPHEALECLYEIDSPRAHRLIEMIKFYDDELDSMGAEEDYRDDNEFMDEYGEDELPDWMLESKVVKLKESDLHRIVKKVLNEDFSDDKESLIFKVLRRLKGVSKEQLEYNMRNDLPWDWRGSKEGFYEKMEPRKNYTGSN